MLLSAKVSVLCIQMFILPHDMYHSEALRFHNHSDPFGPWVPPIRYRKPIAPIAQHISSIGISGPEQGYDGPSMGRPNRTVAGDKAIDDLLESYVANATDGKFSDKGFITGVYGCPTQYGNRMHEFLNAFAVAVITGRTLVWQYTHQRGISSLKDCEALLHREAWIPSDKIIGGKPIKRFGWNYQKGRHKDMACSGLEYARGGHEVINLGVLEQFDSFALAAADANLSPEAKSRAKVLFDHGPGLAYGKLTQKAFSFDKVQVLDPSEQVLRKVGFVATDGKRISSSYLIGLHIRTLGNPSRIKRFSNPLMNAITGRPSGTSCGVLFASDDPDRAVDNFRPILAKHNCSLVVSEFPQKNEPDFKNEHGKHTHIGALRDLTLLSFADKLLITCGSTFSMAISERSLRRNPELRIETIGCDHSDLFDRPPFRIGCGVKTKLPF
eukprot:gnl/TRDRNA2_/TRDRNA2_29153_c0_seq1.p1 gnl/TRDRNA2_/TRDRNA2_29153_c0~~gnl/TRDRNA2_/TRDRNA2_29153_c0_seq1.p1  ORF type:complete len:440 (+),score=11.62 gnl/TRDRNA2_/TRDRNA2_29153_c0_seq1:101-1420(+)